MPSPLSDAFSDPLAFGRDCKRILTASSPAAVKRNLLATHAELLFRTAVGDNRPHANVLGFSVRAHRLSTLRYLFREIFIDAPYRFSAGERPVIIDAGSNIGMSILFFKALYPAARITGFEPGMAFDVLKENVIANGLQDVVVHPYALGAFDGTVEFFEDAERPDSLTMSTVAARADAHTKARTVQQVRLSPFVTESVDLLKMDIEGAEQSVVDELVASGAIRRIKQLIVEYHHHIDAQRDDFSRFLSALEASGFGYHITAAAPPGGRATGQSQFQDVLVYAYRKDAHPAAMASSPR